MIVLDFKTVEGDRHGSCYLGQPKSKPDITVKLSSDTFDKISAGEIGGFRAFVSGKLTFEGNLNVLKKLESKYLAEMKKLNY